MRARKGLSLPAWIGLATLGVLQYMGPRPLFVKTAFAESPDTTINEIAMDGIDANAFELRPIGSHDMIEFTVDACD